MSWGVFSVFAAAIIVGSVDSQYRWGRVIAAISTVSVQPGRGSTERATYRRATTSSFCPGPREYLASQLPSGSRTISLGVGLREAIVTFWYAVSGGRAISTELPVTEGFWI